MSYDRGRRARVARVLAECAAASLLAVVSASAQAPKTRVVVLGVTHSNQLVAESYQPAVFRAFFARVAPAAVCVERGPEAFARGSHHEFTYEIQSIAVPWAAERSIPVHPFDWTPKADDELLLYGATWDPPPLVRRRGAPHAFMAFDSTALALPFFYAERDSVRKDYRDWYDVVPARMATDWARRPLPATAPSAGAPRGRRRGSAPRPHGARGRGLIPHRGHRAHPGRGPALRDREAVDLRPADRAGGERESARPTSSPSPPSTCWACSRASGRTRRGWGAWWRGWRRRGGRPRWSCWRRGSVCSPAASRQRRPRDATRRSPPGPARTRVTWTGVQDRSRLDSYADPFGNLTVARRALLEQAREETRRGSADEAARLRAQLERSSRRCSASRLQRRDEYVAGMR